MHGECRFVDPFVIRVLDDSVGEDMGDTVKLNVAIAGASGLVGGHCVEELLVSPRVESVLSVARREGAPREGLTHQVVSFDAPFSLLRTVDVGFSALGTVFRQHTTALYDLLGLVWLRAIGGRRGRAGWSVLNPPRAWRWRGG